MMMYLILLQHLQILMSFLSQQNDNRQIQGIFEYSVGIDQLEHIINMGDRQYKSQCFCIDISAKIP